MAAVVAFRNHLINNLHHPAAVVNQIIDVHGYDSVQEFASATDREIRNLISTIRKTPRIMLRPRRLSLGKVLPLESYILCFTPA